MAEKNLEDERRQRRIAELARRSGYKVLAFEIIFEVLDFVAKRRGGVRRHICCSEVCHGLQMYAFETFGLLAHYVLAEAGIHTSEDLGRHVFCLAGEELLQLSADDHPADFEKVLTYDRQSFALIYEQSISDIEL